jgi:hypothetical protein
MNVSLKIDQLLQNLTNLKASLTEDAKQNAIEFGKVLNASTSYQEDSDLKQLNAQHSEKEENSLAPEWVDLDYGFDISAPRKPNMRELMEALSGETVEELSKRSKTDYAQYTALASQLLYEVKGDGEDSRDWQSIMESEDILTSVRKETGEMLKPAIDVKSEFDLETSVLLRQYPVIKNEAGETLRQLHGSPSKIENVLKNYGVTELSIPATISEKVDKDFFDSDVLALLENFPKPEIKNTEANIAIEQNLLTSTATAISNKIMVEINDYKLL